MTTCKCSSMMIIDRKNCEIDIEMLTGYYYYISCMQTQKMIDNK